MARRQRDTGKGSWTELILFVMVIIFVYFLLALFDSSLTGEGGREWGKYLREKWGGAVIVLLLFGMYVCIAKFMKLRIPKLPRQILGTLQLYISFAFLLGFLRENGWNSQMTLFQPGSFGSGLAKFFVLNIGTFITLLLVAGSFILSAMLYGSKILKLTVPAMPAFKLKIRRKKLRRRRRERKETYRYEPELEETPEDILLPDDMPSPKFNTSRYDEDYTGQFADFVPDRQPLFTDLPDPTFTREREPRKAPPRETPPAKLKTGQKAIEIIDDAIAILNAGAADTPRRKAPAESSSSMPAPRPRKMRRPLPELAFPDSRAASSRNVDTDTVNDDSVFPPPAEIFGERARFEPSRSIQRDTDRQGRTIINTLKNFGISASIAQTAAGPAVVQYKIELAPGTKISKVSGLDEEIALDLAVMPVRIEAPILGTHYVGVEVPVSERKIVSLRSLIESGEFINTTARLPLPLGVKTGGRILVKGLEEMPHILAAGAEGSGRRTFVNSCILSLCGAKTPKELKLLLIDPGHVEFSAYEGLPHLLAAPVTGLQTARKALEWACEEMDRRTADFAQEKAKNIEAYNRKVPKNKRIPEIVIVIRELSDLLYSAGNDFADLIVKLARKSGSAGIYMILAAQKPSVDVLPPLVKSVIPARAAFKIDSATDSKNVIDTSDAVKLTGKGDMLFVSTGSPVPTRLQTPYITDERIADFVEYMAANLNPPELMTF